MTYSYVDPFGFYLLTRANGQHGLKM